MELFSKLDFVGFIFHFFFLTAWGWSCIGSILLCCLFWFAALSRFELSYVAPFLSLNFMLVMILSMIFLHEAFTWNKIVGVGVITVGVMIVGSGA
ncbi:MAG: EamA family transporter [Proteobacteria bacterium]|nr:EamA family transporter [Pseudomonadota bacterium]